jgi:acetyl-CoA acetyltransferase
MREGLGIWEHRGMVAAVGIGHSPTARRWDGTANSSVGAWALEALRAAIEDAGVSPGDIDGLVLARDTSTEVRWPDGIPIPEDFRRSFVQSSDPLDGLSRLSPEWVLANMPELKNVKFVLTGPECMSSVLVSAIQSVGDGLTTTCLALKGWHNFAGRYGQDSPGAATTVADRGKWGAALAGPACYMVATQFQRYLHKYGKNHDLVAPFVTNSRRNGLLFPEGYWAQHQPVPISDTDYANARWISKPANLLDNDLPIHTAAAYVITTSERAKDLRHRPAYILGHAGAGTGRGFRRRQDVTLANSVIQTLEEIEEGAASTGRKIFEAAGITVSDLSFENLYDGFSFLHVFSIEGIGYAGIKRGEALDLFQTDITIEGPNPVSPSGGNIGGGRTRFWAHTDSIQQIQGRAGARQITRPAEVGLSGGPSPTNGNFIVWGRHPD